MSFSRTWQDLNLISPNTTLTWFIIGFFASFVFLRNILFLVGAVVAVIFIIIGGVVFTDQFFIKISTLGIGMIIGSIGWYFFKQLFALRKGICSFEAYTHTWLEIFENCIFLPEDATQHIPLPSLFLKIKDKIKELIKTLKIWE